MMMRPLVFLALFFGAAGQELDCTKFESQGAEAVMACNECKEWYPDAAAKCMACGGQCHSVCDGNEESAECQGCHLTCMEKEGEPDICGNIEVVPEAQRAQLQQSCATCQGIYPEKTNKCMMCGGSCAKICEGHENPHECYEDKKYARCHKTCMKMTPEQAQAAAAGGGKAMKARAGAASQSCMLDSSEFVFEGINAALYIWASTERCHGAWLANSPVKCAIDVSASIQSVTAMSAAISKMVDQCDGIDKSNHKCAWAANAVVSATAGLAASSANIADKCAHVSKAPYDGDVLDTLTTLGKCTAASGMGMNTLFEVSNTMKSIKHKCAADPHSKECQGEGVEAVYILAQLGAYISYAVSNCGTYHAHATNSQFDNTDAECSGAILDTIAQLHRVAEVGTKMSHDCKPSGQRLYLDTDKTPAATGTPLLTTLLAAALPVTGVVSFVVGSRFAKSVRQGYAYQDPELLMSAEE